MQKELTKPLLETARYLAANGRQAAAISLLDQSPDGDGDPPTSALLLKAKIFVQQGDKPKAIDCWNRVLESDPHNTEAQAALRRARSTSMPVIGRLIYYSSSFQICALLLLILGGSGLYLTARAIASPRQVALAPQVGANTELKSQIADLQQRLSNLETAAEQEASAEPDSRLQAAPDPAPESAEPSAAPWSDDLRERMSEAETERQRLADRCAQLEADLDAYRNLISSQIASHEGQLGAFNERLVAHGMRADVAEEDRQAWLQDLDARIQKLASVNERWQLYELAERVRLWRYFGIVFRDLAARQVIRKEVQDAMAAALQDLEAMEPDEKWDAFLKASHAKLSELRAGN